MPLFFKILIDNDPFFLHFSEKKPFFELNRPSDDGEAKKGEKNDLSEEIRLSISFKYWVHFNSKSNNLILIHY